MESVFRLLLMSRLRKLMRTDMVSRRSRAQLPLTTVLDEDIPESARKPIEPEAEDEDGEANTPKKKKATQSKKAADGADGEEEKPKKVSLSSFF